MRTVHVEPGEDESISAVLAEIHRLIGEGRGVAVSIAALGEWLTSAEVADRLGCRRQHVEWLIRTGELEAYLPGDGHGWQVSLESLLDYEARRESSLRRIDALQDWADRLRAAS